MLTESGASVQYELTRGECVDGLHAAAARNRSTWAILLLGVAVIAVGATTSTAAVFGGSGLLVVGVLAMTVAPAIRGRALWKRRVRLTLSVSETHVSMVSPNSKGEMAWSQFRRLDCSGDLFLLWYANSRRLLTIIPRRAFASEEQADSFRDFAQGHLGARS